MQDDFSPCFTVTMPRVLAVLGRAAPFHGPSAVASGAVTEEEAAAITRIQVGFRCLPSLWKGELPTSLSALAMCRKVSTLH